jgi:hypothetical protein
MRKVNQLRQAEERFAAMERRRVQKAQRRQRESKATGAALEWLKRQKKEQSNERIRND